MTLLKIILKVTSLLILVVTWQEFLIKRILDISAYLPITLISIGAVFVLGNEVLIYASPTLSEWYEKRTKSKLVKNLILVSYITGFLFITIGLLIFI